MGTFLVSYKIGFNTLKVGSRFIFHFIFRERNHHFETGDNEDLL